MRTIRDFADGMAGKRVLMRVDFNVPLDKQTGEITNDLRIRMALPTIRFATERGARVVLMSHFGRPKGTRDEKYSLRKVAGRLGELLGVDVAFAPDCVGTSRFAFLTPLQRSLAPRLTVRDFGRTA